MEKKRRFGDFLFFRIKLGGMIFSKIEFGIYSFKFQNMIPNLNANYSTIEIVIRYIMCTINNEFTEISPWCSY